MQSRAFQQNQEYILPARFDDTEIPGVLPTVGYINLRRNTAQQFVEIIKRKLVGSGLTVPSDSIRRAVSSITVSPRVDPLVSRITVISTEGHPVVNATIVAIASNNTTLDSITDENGVGALSVLTRRSYQLLIAHEHYLGAMKLQWDPVHDITFTLPAADNVGSIVCKGTCHIPGFKGRLNPILDATERRYMYADNIAINDGQVQPVHFAINELLHMEDCDGVMLDARVLFLAGTTSLLEFLKTN